MSETIRVVVANQPTLMRELVLETIAEQPDIEIVAEVRNEKEIERAIEATHPHFLIIALDETDERPSICDVLLRRFPEMRILALAPERNTSIFFWASFHIYACSVEVSEAGILGTLRSKSEFVGG